MNKFLSVLVVGMLAGTLSAGAMATDAAKPTDVSASKASTASLVKKDTGVKASLKKGLPSSKKEAK